MSELPIQRIVLTGGPGAGKTVITSRLARAEPARFACVPEAATQVYHALRTRWDELDIAGRRDVQRRIYRLQVEQEDRIARERPGQVLLLDRGTVDGSAYWPDGPEAYWRDLGTTAERELGRYDAVIWMQSAASIGLYDGNASNAKRFEDAEQAVRNGEMLRTLWAAHRRMSVVPATRNLAEKILEVRRRVDALLAF